MTAAPRRSVAVVTGAASGIGLATAERAAATGFRVVAVDLADRGEHERVARRSGGVARAVDVREAEALWTLVDEVESTLGPIEVAILCAGVLRETALPDVTDALWDETLSTHLGGAFYMTRALVPPMRRRHDGSIVTVASELVLTGAADHVHYVAAKAAVVGFTKAVARELATQGIRINAVAPGPVDTPLLGPSGRTPEYVDSIPLRRLGTPQEVARCILDIAMWTWTTGQVYRLDGGAVIQ